MFFSKFPRLLRLISCLALFQVFAPALVAVADAWQGDARQAYAHIEAETGSSCVEVHHDECALCSFLSTGSAAAQSANTPWPLVVADICPVDPAWSTPQLERSAGHGQRAPPIS